MKMYGKNSDTPAWRRRKPRWSTFVSPSKAAKSECTLLIKCLLQHFGIDPAVHYIDYPDEEESEESSNSSLDPADEDIHVGDGEPADNSAINNSLPHDAAEDNYEEMEDKFQRYEKEQEQLRPD